MKRQNQIFEKIVSILAVVAIFTGFTLGTDPHAAQAVKSYCAGFSQQTPKPKKKVHHETEDQKLDKLVKRYERDEKRLAALKAQQKRVSEAQKRNHRKHHGLVKVYIYVYPNNGSGVDDDEYFKDEVIAGANAWNQTGATRFIMTNSKKKASVYIHQASLMKDDDVGYTEFNNNGTVTIKVDTSYIDRVHDKLLATIEHELGHAAGLDHVKDKNSVMYPNDSYSHTAYITPQNIAKAKKTYKQTWKY